jgi:hypothetical protein
VLIFNLLKDDQMSDYFFLFNIASNSGEIVPADAGLPMGLAFLIGAGLGLSVGNGLDIGEAIGEAIGEDSGNLTSFAL